ncbi:hypothetical protein BCR34DRAFT_628281 [Clohesyomyces aquaticus]|uniref:NAD(P)-binding protein n=1 Tax=Clohesyomyces aquaticus TaxID=1231657 RepID=A0A1Y1YLZ8_9PLEO|nr:hypothetical protein BCR34DRAFT_628281 [Clohesyomyces aquaticus]
MALGVLSRFWNQSFFLPKPTFTEKDLPDLTGKVYIITGGYTGIGLELCKLLYPHNPTIYIAGRSSEKASIAIQALQTAFPDSKGRLEFLQLDLADLSTIKASVDSFLQKEDRLDVLVNNAGIMVPPIDMKSAQNYDLQTATNVYGPFLLTQLLLPLLKKTVRVAETGTVRVCWAALGGRPEVLYGQSKCANVMLGIEGARRWAGEGVISNSFNPGNLRSELARHSNWIQVLIMKFITHPVYLGGYTELFSGWSPEITSQKNGCYVIPWGRFGIHNAELESYIKPLSEGGPGTAQKLWLACEKVVQPYT